MSALPRRTAADVVEPSIRAEDRALLASVLAGLTEDDLEVCGGALVVHADGRTECLGDARCSTDPALHVGRLECAEAIDGGCCAAG